jgi:hypothetical protein
LGGATNDAGMIHNLPLHLMDSAHTWLKHLPASQIHGWDDVNGAFWYTKHVHYTFVWI